MWLARGEERDRGSDAIDAFLRELDELRELARRRQTHAPGSSAYDQATREIDRRNARLMDVARDLDARDLDRGGKPQPPS